MRSKLLLTLISIFLCFSASCWAATHYASPAGSAAWVDCIDAEHPCALTTAMTNAVAGDIVYLADGTYEAGATGSDEIPYFTPSNSGSEGNEIVFIATNLHGPIITNSSPASPWNAYIGVMGKSYIVFDGLTVQQVGVLDQVNKPITFSNGASYCHLRNCDLIGDNLAFNHNTSMIQMVLSNHIYIYNNKIHSVTGSTNTNVGLMWLIMGPEYIYIYNNDLYDSYHGIMVKGTAQHIYVYNNFYHDFVHSANFSQINGEGTEYIFHHNVAIDVNMFFTSPDAAALNYDTQLYNNTVYSSNVVSGSGTAIIRVGGSGENNKTRNSKIYNNIIQAANGSVFDMLNTGLDIPDICDYNQYYGTGTWSRDYATETYSVLADWTTDTTFDANSVTTDPGFLNASGLWNAATDLKRASYTANGRGGAYESVMGAYIDGTELIGYQAGADTTPPVVVITEPSAGSVSGTISVTATCTDAVGCVGVQFKRDGANLGSEDTESPWTISWDTTGVDNGNYSLLAVGRDAVGNSANSAAVAVNVANGGSGIGISGINAGAIGISNINAGAIGWSNLQ